MTKAQFARYSSFSLAQARALDSMVCVFMGDDGKYWVPHTMKSLAVLERAGYEVAA